MLEANVTTLVEPNRTLLDRLLGRNKPYVIRGKNTITDAGKTWALQKLFGSGTASIDLTHNVRFEVGVNNVWQRMTIDNTTGYSKSGAVATITGVYNYTGNNQRTAAARIVLGIIVSGVTTGAQTTFAQYSFPKPFIGKTGGRITMTWAITAQYIAANDYDDSEISRVRESLGGENTRQLWLPETDQPIVANKIMDILYGRGPANTLPVPNPSKITHGQVRMFEIDTSLTDNQLDQLGDAGPFPILQDSGDVINGTFAVNNTTKTLDFRFAWSGVGTDTGVRRKRWFFMTFGASASTANSVRWTGGAHLESDDLPTAATNYTTGIRLA